MQYQFTPYALLPLCTVVVEAMLAYDTWRRRGDPASMPFLALTFLVGLWSFGNAFELSSATAATAFFWVRIEYIAIVLVPVVWLMMMLAFSERRTILSHTWVVSLLLIPLITTAIIWSSDQLPGFMPQRKLLQALWPLGARWSSPENTVKWSRRPASGLSVGESW